MVSAFSRLQISRKIPTKMGNIWNEIFLYWNDIKKNCGYLRKRIVVDHLWLPRSYDGI